MTKHMYPNILSAPQTELQNHVTYSYTYVQLHVGVKRGLSYMTYFDKIGHGSNKINFTKEFALQFGVEHSTLAFAVPVIFC
jgi:hypothetical protein